MPSQPNPVRPLAAALVLLLAAAPALAQTMVPKLDQEGRKGDMARLAKEQAMAKFDALDVNKDGKLSREEVEKGSPYLSENFDKRDLDKDGFLSWEEYVGHDRWPKNK